MRTVTPSDLTSSWCGPAAQRGGEMRTDITAQRHEYDVLFAGSRDTTATDDAMGVAEQHDFQKY
jgi:hypothetical protein